MASKSRNTSSSHPQSTAASHPDNAPSPRILYATPDIPYPSGGVKVLYRHAETLHRMGYDAWVMHFQEGFRCVWFAHDRENANCTPKTWCRG